MNDLNKRSIGIDIIKALSLISVIIYHLYEYKGTYIGVVLFFVISGYLITEVLYERDDSYYKFIKRRYTKIFPPLIVVLVASCLAFYYFYGYISFKLIWNSLSSLFGLSNIYQILSGMSYFERSGDLFPLLHTWSLSIEIQFYVVFPFFIYLFKKINLRKNLIASILTIFSLASAGMMAYKEYIGYDLSAIYYGTDTRIFSILVGSAFYFIFKDRNLRKKEANTISYILLVVVVVSILMVDYSTPANYYGLLYLISLAGAFMTVTALKTEFLNFQNFAFKPLSKLGEHSYVYYLWQYPLMIFSLEYFKWSDIDYNLTVALQILILIILSEFSYKILIEQKQGSKILRRIFLGIYLGVIFCLPISTETNSQEVKNQIMLNEETTNVVVKEEKNELLNIKNQVISDNSNNEEKIDYLESRLLADDEEMKNEKIVKENKINEEKIKVQENEKEKDKKKLDDKSEKVKNTKEDEDLREPKEKKDTKNITTDKENNKDTKKEKIKNKDAIDGKNYTFIGDSVMKMGEPYIKELFTDAVVDAKVSRQFVDLPKILESLKADKKLKDTVVIHLGTNGVINKKAFENSMEYLKGKKVYIMNTVVPKPWEKGVNKNLEEWSEEYSNITIIDWHKYAKGEKDLFFKDATHPRPEGAKKYAELILKKVK